MQYSASAGKWVYINPGTFGVTFIDQEVMSGTIDGTNAVFTLAHTPNPGSSLVVKINGLEENQSGGCYALSGNTVTFSGLCIPQPLDVPFASYRY
jgi:hypothetical protein